MMKKYVFELCEPTRYGKDDHVDTAALIIHCHVIGENWKIGSRASEETSKSSFFSFILCRNVKSSLHVLKTM